MWLGGVVVALWGISGASARGIEALRGEYRRFEQSVRSALETMKLGVHSEQIAPAFALADQPGS